MTFNELVKDILFYRNKENYCIKIKEENKKMKQKKMRQKKKFQQLKLK